MLSDHELREMRERDASYGDRLGRHWVCQYHRRVLLQEVDRLRAEVASLTSERHQAR